MVSLGPRWFTQFSRRRFKKCGRTSQSDNDKHINKGKTSKIITIIGIVSEMISIDQNCLFVVIKYNKCNKIARKMTPTLFTLLFLFLITTIATQSWIPVRSGTLSIPGHTYPILCQSGQTLTATIRWPDSNVDLDAYLYLYGDVMSNANAIAYADRTLLYWESLSYNITTNGYYYLRVYAYRLVSNASYTIEIARSGSPNITTYSGLFHIKNRLMNAISVTLPAFSSANLTKIPILYIIRNNYVEATITMSIQPSMSSLDIEGTGVLCLPLELASSPLIFVFGHEEKPFVGVEQISYEVYVIEDPSYCPKDKPEEMPVALFLFLVAGLPVIVITAVTLIIAAVISYRNKRNQVNAAVEQFAIQEEPSLGEDIRVPEKEACSICLESRCNAYLPCRHWFHEACLRAWFGRNGGCPMCRGKYGPTDIRKPAMMKQ